MDTDKDLGARVALVCGFLALIVIAALVLQFLPGCSGPQRQAWGVAASDLGDCLVNCGASKAKERVTSVLGGGWQFDIEDLGWDALGCALPCLTRFGVVATETIPRAAGRYGGSAGESDVYRGPLIRVTVSPPR